MHPSPVTPACNPAQLLGAWTDELNAAIAAADPARFGALFGAESYWRDYLALAWDFKTYTGPRDIEQAFASRSRAAGLGPFCIAEGRTPPSLVRRSGRWLVEGYLGFSTTAGVGSAFVRLAYDASRSEFLQAWQLMTSLDHLHDFQERVGDRRRSGEKDSKLQSALSWRERRDEEIAFRDREPEVLVIGAGHSGLMLSARLRQMGVDALVIERLPRVGDNWRRRYNNLTLHNELTANHFPYLDFPSNWPVWLPKDMLADWMEAYSAFQELNVWAGAELLHAEYEPKEGGWDVLVRQADGQERRLKPKHLVAAMGLSGGTPRRADLPGAEDFAGTILHSAEFTSGRDWVGKRAVVIGTGNSGHDIAQDLHVAGAAEVHLVQRGPTCVVSLDPSAMISYSVYNEGRSIEDADLMVAAMPYPVLIDTYRWITRKTDSLDRKLLDGLRGIGFRLTSGEDETGFQLLYLRGAGGYYIDVGCSSLLIDGKIGLLQAEQIDRLVPDGIRMTDGSLLPCDLVVTATGFETMQASIRRLLGDEVADRVGPIWGFDEEHNLRNMWKRTAQENFWVMGGAIIEARLFSRFLALQIKAALLGQLPPPEQGGRSSEIASAAAA